MQPCKPCNSSSARCCSGSFQWQAPLCLAGSTVTRAARDRPHLEDASITQLFKSTVRSRSLLGKQEIPVRPNSIDVRVGDKLKVVQFHPVIRNSVDSITQNNKLRLAPTRCSLDSQYVHIRCPLPVKTRKNRVSEQEASVNRGDLWIRIASPIILSLSVKAS